MNRKPIVEALLEIGAEAQKKHYDSIRREACARAFHLEDEPLALVPALRSLAGLIEEYLALEARNAQGPY